MAFSLNINTANGVTRCVQFASDSAEVTRVVVGDRAVMLGLRQLALDLEVVDELVLDAPESVSERAAVMVAELMASVADLAVPLKVDVGIGPNWAQAHS